MKITVEVNDRIFRNNTSKFLDFFNHIVNAMGECAKIDTSHLYGRYDVNTDVRTSYAFCSIEAENKKEGENA